MYVGAHFGGSFVDALQTVSKKFDGDRIVRFGWMRKSQIIVISAVVISRPIHACIHTYIHNVYIAHIFLLICV
jgi:hypothetical protein